MRTGPVVDHGRRRSPASRPLWWGNSCHELEKRGRGPGAKRSPALVEFYYDRWFQKRTEEGELTRRHFGVGGKAAHMMLCSSPCTHGRAAHGMTTRPNRKAEAAQRRDEGGDCRVGRLGWNWAQRPL
jgi:hypothetical protein